MNISDGIAATDLSSLLEQFEQVESGLLYNIGDPGSIQSFTLNDPQALHAISHTATSEGSISETNINLSHNTSFLHDTGASAVVYGSNAIRICDKKISQSHDDKRYLHVQDVNYKKNDVDETNKGSVKESESVQHDSSSDEMGLLNIRELVDLGLMDENALLLESEKIQRVNCETSDSKASKQMFNENTKLQSFNSESNNCKGSKQKMSDNNRAITSSKNKRGRDLAQCENDKNNSSLAINIVTQESIVNYQVQMNTKANVDFTSLKEMYDASVLDNNKSERQHMSDDLDRNSNVIKQYTELSAKANSGSLNVETRDIYIDDSNKPDQDNLAIVSDVITETHLAETSCSKGVNENLNKSCDDINEGCELNPQGVSITAGIIDEQQQSVNPNPIDSSISHNEPELASELEWEYDPWGEFKEATFGAPVPDLLNPKFPLPKKNKTKKSSAVTDSIEIGTAGNTFSKTVINAHKNSQHSDVVEMRSNANYKLSDEGVTGFPDTLATDGIFGIRHEESRKRGLFGPHRQKPRKKREPEAPEERFYDRLPSYYTVFSLPNRTATGIKVAPTITPLPAAESVAVDNQPEGYDKLPSYYSCFTNSTVFDEDGGMIEGGLLKPSIGLSQGSSGSNPFDASDVAAQIDYRGTNRGRSSNNYRTDQDRNSITLCEDRGRSSKVGIPVGSSDRLVSTGTGRSTMGEIGYPRRERAHSPQYSVDLLKPRLRAHRRGRSSLMATATSEASLSPNIVFQSDYVRSPRRRYTVRGDRKLRHQTNDRERYEKRHILYIGRIPNGYSNDQLRRQFGRFGEIETSSVHFRETGDNYAFVTYKSMSSAIAANDNGNLLPGCGNFDICFGGRRKFCDTDYTDLDGKAHGESDTLSSHRPHSAARYAGASNISSCTAAADSCDSSPTYCDYEQLLIDAKLRASAAPKTATLTSESESDSDSHA